VILHLASRDLPRDALGEVLGKIAVPETAWAWVRWSEGARLAPYAPGSRELLASHTGRVFWPEAELRWQVLECGVRMVYLGDVALALEGFAQETVESERSNVSLLLQDVAVIETAAMPALHGDERWALCSLSYQTVERGTFERFAGVTTISPQQEGHHDAEGQ
jgi:hypothetical protein